MGVFSEQASWREGEYAGNYIYKNGNLQFFNTVEGYVENNGIGGCDYIYQYKDHLGNIRLSYSDDDGSTIEMWLNKTTNTLESAYPLK